jgi:flavin-dependent dehydrogenase
MHFDLLVVGAGPAGLSAAIRFKQASRSKCIEACLEEGGSVAQTERRSCLVP